MKYLLPLLLSINAWAVGPFDERRVIFMYEEFYAGTGVGVYTASNTGSGATFATVGGSLITSSRHGVVGMSTGTTNTGRSAAASSTLKIGNNTIFETSVNVATLSTLAEEYTLEHGFGDQGGTTSSANTEGIWFRYDRLTSTNWLRCTASASASTTCTDTGTAVSTSWVTLRWVLNSAGTSAEFFINGSSVGTNSTNMPAGATNVRPFARMLKSAGTTSITTYIDYASYRTNLSTPR